MSDTSAGVRLVNGRLARWLLTIQDRTGNTLLKLTQEFLARDDRLAKNNRKRGRWWVPGPRAHRICAGIDQDSRQDRTRKLELRMRPHNQKLTRRGLQACPSTGI